MDEGCEKDELLKLFKDKFKLKDDDAPRGLYVVTPHCGLHRLCDETAC